MPKQTKRLNRSIIASNLAEAADQIQSLHEAAVSGELSEAELQVGLCHAYHHLNFAWNIRFASTSQYASLTETQFREWGRYPAEIETL